MVETTDQKYQREEKRISNALMASFVVLAIQYFVLVSLNLMGTPMGARVQLMSKALVGIVFLYAFPIVLKRSLKRFLVIYWGAALLFVVHYFVFPQNQAHMQSLFLDIFLISMPAFTYSMAISDFDIFKRSMRHAAHIVMVFGTLTAAYSFTGRASVGEYSMSLSYYMLLPALIYLDRLIDNFCFKRLFLVVVSLVVILSLGARGPVMCIGVFFLLKIMKPHAKWTKLRVFGFGSLIAGLVGGVVFFYEILLLLDNLLRSLGISSRTLRLFMQGSVHLSGRERLYQLVVPEILDSPFIGIGIAGDYRIIGNYVHNIFIEVLGNFGVIVGGIFIMVFLTWVLRLLLKSNTQVFGLVSLWLSLGFVHLMVSGSYLVDIQFWIFLGLVVNLSLGTGRKGYKNEQQQSAIS